MLLHEQDCLGPRHNRSPTPVERRHQLLQHGYILGHNLVSFAEMHVLISKLLSAGDFCLAVE